MTLPEVLVASAILATSSGASLQVWAQAAQATVQGQRQEEGMERLNAQLLAAHRQLQNQITQPCSPQPEPIGQLLEGLPLPSDLQRSLQTDSASGGVWLEVRQPASGAVRRRLFTIAGLGGCATPATPASPATQQHAEEHAEEHDA